jgi:uncharacterized protein
VPHPPSGDPAAPGPLSYFSPERWSGRSWGLGDVVTAFVVGVVASNLVAVVLIGVAGADATNPPLWIQVVAELPLWAAFIGVSVLATRIKGDGPAADLGLRLRWYDAPLGIAIGAFGQLVLVGLVYWPIFKLLGHSVDVGQVAQNLADQAHGVGGEILLLGLVSVGAPIAEEIYFRGLTQRSLLKQRRLARGNPWLAIVITAAFFGVAHFELAQFPALFAFGLVLGVLAWRTRRLGPGIWAHLTFNAIAAATLVWNLHLPTFSP